METDVATGVAQARERVAAAAARAGRDATGVHILAAAKYVDAPTVAALVRAGIRDIAENRVDALVARREALAGELPDDVRWHFIGRLQSRQAPLVAANVDLVHSLCTVSAAARLAAAAREGTAPGLLLQVNIDGDPGKDGLLPGDVDAFLDALPEPLRVSGLMTMPAFAEDAESSRRAFTDLRDLRDRLATTHAGRHDVAELSMGTSQDFEVAVEEGATLVRLGRVLYAPHA